MHAFRISMTRKSAIGFVCALLASIPTITAMLGASPAFAAIEPFPPDFKIQSIAVNGATLHVRVGGKGPAVVFLRAFADTGDMWAPLAKALYQDHTVIVPDLRGMGLSSQPAGGYDKKTQGGDIATHDIGNRVGYALAAQYPDRITKWVVSMRRCPASGRGTKS